jgi:hypothetical protein
MAVETGTCEATCEFNRFHERLRGLDIRQKCSGGDTHGNVTTAIAELMYTNIKPWQTRILRLRHGETQDELKAELLTVYMTEDTGAVLKDEDERIKYVALSYCWGSQVFDRAIRIRDVPYPITETLYLALKRIRSRQDDEYLWVDMLCINQHDPQERASQVINMLQIFRKAVMVVIWLDDHDLRSAWFFHCMSAMLPSGRVASASIALCTYHTNLLISGIHAISVKPWYRRIWVQQEAW